jgi:hypothetical protein
MARIEAIDRAYWDLGPLFLYYCAHGAELAPGPVCSLLNTKPVAIPANTFLEKD